MSKMLASVDSLTDALLVLATGVDIIDLKQPAAGALGALDHLTVRTIVANIAKRCPVSATIGDLPMQAHCICPAVEDMAATGVDFIKIGFFPTADWATVLTSLQAYTSQDVKLIAVLFADTAPDFAVLAPLQQAGFTGVMLDTMHKQAGSLLQVMRLETIHTFIHTAKQLGFLTGLAGSLRLEDIATLLPLQADYLGFRGALCQQQQRTSIMDPNALRTIRANISP